MGRISDQLNTILHDPDHRFHAPPRAPFMPDSHQPDPAAHQSPDAEPASGAAPVAAPHRLETLLVLSNRPRRVKYREACPPYHIIDANLVAERPDGRAIVFYLRGQNPVMDVAAQHGLGQFGGYRELTPEERDV